MEGLISQSWRPKHSPAQKVFEQEAGWILALRRERKLGTRRIQHVAATPPQRGDFASRAHTRQEGVSRVWYFAAHALASGKPSRSLTPPT